MTAAPLRVALDARLPPGVAGGVQQFVEGLIAGLDGLAAGGEEYHVLAQPETEAWLGPYLSPRWRVLQTPADTLGVAVPAWKRAVARVVPAAAVRWATTGPWRAALPIPVPSSDGTIERAGIEVMHFTLQSGFLTEVPSIYQPYDLQHVHLPQFFDVLERRRRDTVYRALAHAARAVVVMSSWVKRDVVRHLGVGAEKVFVIPWGPVTQLYRDPTPAELAAAQARLRLPGAFGFFPAQTFPHKNHEAVLRALAFLRRERRASLPVVFSGRLTAHHARLARLARELGVEDLARFVGYVSPLELKCLYRTCRFLVFPSRFEGGGMPIFEAFSEGVPVACSDVTCLPEQVGDAALLFAPDDVAGLAAAIHRLWEDHALRASLTERGRLRVEGFSWRRTAGLYRALYRHAAGRASEGDRALLAAPPPL